MKHKIVTLNELYRRADELRRKRKKIIAFNGSFDLLHAGHVHSLEDAKKQGDVLMVLINSDASVRSYKGPKRPVVPENERAELIAALACVDYVALFDDINPKRVLLELKPDILCKGDDWGKNCIERDVVELYGGKIHILPKTHASTDTISRINEAYALPQVKAVFLDRDGTINRSNDKGYTYNIEDFTFLPGVIPALKRLSKTDYKIIIITNQSGIGRGYYTEKDMQKLHRWMIGELAKKGARIDRIYYCPHAPEVGCACRKPGIAMFLSAVSDFGISLNDSWFVGDDDRDVLAGREANIKTIKLGPNMNKTHKLEPHAYAKGLAEAVDMILKKQ